MRRIWAVTRKELTQIRRDPLSLLILIGLPTLLLVLYGFALNFDVRHVRLAVQDNDKSAASRDLVAALVNSTYFDVVATPVLGEDLARYTEERIAKAVLVIPEGFGRDLAAGRGADLQVLLDGADALTATTVLGYAGALVAEQNVRLVRRTFDRLGRRLEAGVAYEPRIWYNPELTSTRFLLPGLIGMILMLTAVMATALSIVRESERGTMEQLRVAPVREVEIILGKTTPYLAISFLATAIVLLAARLLFGVTVAGSYVDLAIVTLIYLLGALGIGLLISTVANTQAFAFQVGLLVSLLPAMLLSGFIFQIRSMPAALRAVTCLVPSRYYLVVLRGVILKGAPLSTYWEQMALLALFALVTLGLATLRLARAGRSVR